MHQHRELRAGPPPLRERLRRGQDADSSSNCWTSAAAFRALRRKRAGLHRARRGDQSEIDRLFPKPVEILAEPGRFLVATTATAVVQIIGKAIRDGKRCYYVDDGVYHTFCGVIFDHCRYPLKSFKNAPTQICSVFGPTCDALDTICLAEELPDLELGDLLYARTSAPTLRPQHLLQRVSASQGCAYERVTGCSSDGQ